MRNPYLFFFAAVLPAVYAPPAAAEPDGIEEDDTYTRCIQSRSIRSTSVENDRNIVFFMRGNRIYLNILPKACRGLSREGRFSYVSHTSSLCRSDRINVLRDSGFGLQTGRSCKLGMFRPVTKDDLADLFEREGEPVRTKEVQPPAVEDVTTEDGAAAGEEPDD